MAIILIIDDEPLMRELMRDILEMAGHKVLEAVDGVAGIETYTRYSPDMVITDILMPNMGGLQFISSLRKIDSKAKIIAISGGGREGKLNFLATAKTFSDVVVLKKPCPRGELIDAVSKLLALAHSDSDACPRRGTLFSFKTAI